MHVNLEKMRCWQAKIPILLTGALVVLNAPAIARCSMMCWIALVELPGLAINPISRIATDGF
jgi:hypothetical protein